jgi:hypothetical protein
MSCREVYDILGLLLQSQNSNVRLLEFLTRDVSNSDVDNAPAEFDDDISEILTEPAKRTVNSQPSRGDKGNGSPLSLLSAPGTCTASPAIEPPFQSSQPLSKSVIKAAIENVAESGFLTITSDATAIDAPNQVLQHFETPQQDGKEKTGDSNSTK